MRKPWLDFYQDIQQLCEPLYQNIQVNYFAHAYVEPNGSFYILANNPAPTEYYIIEQGLPPSGLINFHLLTSGVYFIGLTDDVVSGLSPGTMKFLNERFNIRNPILIINKTDNFADFFVFSFDDENGYKTAINNQGLLQQFLFYYKDKARDIIKNASMFMPKYDITSITHDALKLYVPESKFDFLPVSGYWITTQNGNIKLTNEEYEIFKALGQGYETKEIAALLYKSYSTVKNTLERIRDKLKVNRRSDLRKLYKLNHPILF